jgi:hypothetical protein
MFKKTASALTLVVAMTFTTSSAFAACSLDTEKDGKSACAANQVCYLVEGNCIDKKSLQNLCVKEDGKETNSDGSETGQCN